MNAQLLTWVLLAVAVVVAVPAIAAVAVCGCRCGVKQGREGRGGGVDGKLVCNAGEPRGRSKYYPSRGSRAPTLRTISAVAALVVVVAAVVAVAGAVVVVAAAVCGEGRGQGGGLMLSSLPWTCA